MVQLVKDLQLYTQLREHFAPQNQETGSTKGNIHKTLMLFSWILLANIGLWAHFFKYKKWAIPLHIACMSILTLSVSLAGFLALIQFGINSMTPLHVDFGITILTLMTIVAIGGSLCYAFQSMAEIKPILVYILNRIHRFGGKILLVIVMLQLLTTLYSDNLKLFLLVIFTNVFLYILFYIFKFRSILYNNMQAVSMTQPSSNQMYENLKIVKNEIDSSNFKKDYFIFADKIYDIDNIIERHPGGWQIINAIRRREIDRYWYGMQALEIFEKNQMRVHNHSDMAIKMAGIPIGILYNISPYQSMQQITLSQIKQIVRPCHHKMYLIYLFSKSHPFKFQGYTQFSQLGKYYTVNINKNKTRLYSVVNFLHPSNIQLMEKIIGNNAMVRLIQIDYQNVVPLFVKRYENGKFTKEFTSGNLTSEVRLSRPRGRGLLLNQLTPGLVLMFAGGTGLNPYCDLIDLLFKQTLILQGNPLANQILSKNPILHQQNLRTFEYILYIAVETFTQIHPLTLYQLNYLAHRNRIKVYLKSKQINLLYQYLIRQTNKFEQVFQQYLQESNKISQIYICGPPSFSHTLVKQLNKFNLNPLKYKVL